MHKYTKPIIFLSLIFLITAACKKDNELTMLKFSKSDRKWFIYQPGQKYKFTNDAGDSIVYTVMKVEDTIETEYNWLPPFQEEIGKKEYYLAKLKSNTDSIRIYFGKEFQGNTNPDGLKHGILWISMKSQFPRLSVLEDKIPFSTVTLNGKTYNTVTPIFFQNSAIETFTKWINATYDQKSGFVEIIDVNNISWKRQ